MTWIDQQLQEGAELVSWLREAERTSGLIRRMADRLVQSLTSEGRVLSCGNGGSMSDAMHFAEELSGRYRGDRKALAASAISDPGHLTCVANDYGFDRVFSRGVEAWGRQGDTLVVFSTSGRSRNIVAAADAARARSMTVLGLLGRDGGVVRGLCDEALVVPAQDSGRIQEVHIKVVHLLVEAIERAICPELYPDAR